MAADGQQPIAEATDDGKQEEPTLDVAAAVASIYHLVGRAHHKLTVEPVDTDDAVESLRQAKQRLAELTEALDDVDG